MVDGSVVAYERAEPEQLREVADEIGARRTGVVRGDRRQVLGNRLDPLSRLSFAAREAEVEVEVGAHGGDPGNAPAHPALVGLQLLERCLRDEGERHVAGAQMRKQAVDAVGHR